MTAYELIEELERQIDLSQSVQILSKDENGEDTFAEVTGVTPVNIEFDGKKYSFIVLS